MSVTRETNSRGVRWRARWRGPDGRERARVFQRKADASAWVAEQRRQVRHGSWVDPAAGQVPVAEYTAAWLDAQSWRDSTRARVVSVLEVHVLPAFGDLALAAVRPSQVRGWVAEMTRTLSPRTVEANYHVLRALMRAAIADELLTRNPTDGVRLPRKDRRVIVPLDVTQVETLADAIRVDLAAAVWVAAGCGLRQGEVLGLTVDRVRWAARQLVVDRQLVTPPGKGQPRLSPLKTERSSRVIPAPDAVMTALAQHVEAFGTGVDGLVFHRRAGGGWHRGRFGEAWRAARATVGLEGVRFHDLRHYCASSLIRAGVSVKGVQEVLGHASATETLEVYAHLWPADQDRAREAMAQSLATSRTWRGPDSATVARLPS
jgi:integrase